MSVPSTPPYRSSSVGSTGDAKPYDAIINEFLKPGGEISQFIAGASGPDLLAVISYLHRSRVRVNEAVENAYEKTKEFISSSVRQTEYSVAMKSLSVAFCKAILDSGKINPVMTKRLHDIIESSNTFDEKIALVYAIVDMNHACDQSVEVASKIPPNERMEVITEILEGNDSSQRYQQIKSQLEIDEKQFATAASQDQPSRAFREILASRIAGTLSESVEKHLSAEINAGSHLSKIKDLLANEITNQQMCTSSTATSSSSALSGSSSGLVHSDEDSLEELFNSVINESAIKARLEFAEKRNRVHQNNSSSNAASHLTTTTNAPTTTTTTNTTTTTTTTTTIPAHTPPGHSHSVISADLFTNKSGQEILLALGYPPSVQKLHPKKWKEAAKLIQKFYKECAPQPGSNRERLLRANTASLKDSVESLAVVSLPGFKKEELADRLALEKNISPNTDAALNKAIIGRSQGYAQRHPEILTGGSPVSTCATVAMMRPDGVIVSPKVACISSPALGKNGAELAAYVQPGAHLDRALYLKARQAISRQITENVLRAGPSWRVILSAVGMGEFLSGLSKEDAAEATKIAAKEMATLIDQLTDKGVSVVYTDRDDQGSFWKQVNTQLKKPVAFIGAVPGNWVEDKDLFINSTSNFYYPGHGGTAAKSLDGQFGDTLLFDAHVLRSIFHSVGLKQEYLG